MRRRKCDVCGGRFPKSDLIHSEEGRNCVRCADFIRRDRAVFNALLELS